MAIIEFIKEAGEKLFHRSVAIFSADVAVRQQQQLSIGSGTGQMGGPPAERRPIGNTREASHALLQYIRLQDLDVPDDLLVVYDVGSGIVSVEGTAPDEETRELIVLLAGNVEGVKTVLDAMTCARRGTPSDFHVVREGETAISIARRHYGDEKMARRILLANAPVLRSTRDVRKGQTIRLPAG
jgi:hypothetical protein